MTAAAFMFQQRYRSARICFITVTIQDAQTFGVQTFLGPASVQETSGIIDVGDLGKSRRSPTTIYQVRSDGAPLSLFI